jgi:hypothetical protein
MENKDTLKKIPYTTIDNISVKRQQGPCGAMTDTPVHMEPHQGFGI